MKLVKKVFSNIINYSSVILQKKNRSNLILGLFLVGLLFLFSFLQENYLIQVPKQGGSISEALLGTPRFINPVLATSQIDKDLTQLIYGSLVETSTTGEIVNQLAQEITSSVDGTEYIITLRDDIYFHDGEKITAQDVLFTINKIKDPVIQSPSRADWIGVTVEELSENQILFELDRAYPLFLQNLTVGILPEHLWSDVSAEEFPFSIKNIQPVGSGPFQVQNITRNDREQIVEYNLSSFRGSVFSPYLDTFTIKVVQTPEDQIDLFNKGSVSIISGIGPENISTVDLDKNTVENYSLPRVFSLFMKQEQNTPLAFSEVREVIDLLIDKEALVSEVFNGYAKASYSPLPPTSPYLADIPENIESREETLDRARTLLIQNSWSFSEEKGLWTKTLNNQELDLSFTLQSPDTSDLIFTANRIRNNLSELRIPVTVLYQDLESLTQEVIRPRDYELLLFGYVTDTPANLYPFWHSQGRVDPGLNIAEYVNITVDKALEDLIGLEDREEIDSAYQTIQQEISKDIPASFLFSPEYIYIHSDKIAQDQSIGTLAFPEDRFANIEHWYVETERILPFFFN